MTEEEMKNTLQELYQLRNQGKDVDRAIARLEYLLLRRIEAKIDKEAKRFNKPPVRWP